MGILFVCQGQETEISVVSSFFKGSAVEVLHRNWVKLAVVAISDFEVVL